jgi:hypothetical protein
MEKSRALNGLDRRGLDRGGGLSGRSGLQLGQGGVSLRAGVVALLLQLGLLGLVGLPLDDRPVGRLDLDAPHDDALGLVVVGRVLVVVAADLVLMRGEPGVQVVRGDLHERPRGGGVHDHQLEIHLLAASLAMKRELRVRHADAGDQDRDELLAQHLVAQEVLEARGAGAELEANEALVAIAHELAGLGVEPAIVGQQALAELLVAHGEAGLARLGRDQHGLNQIVHDLLGLDRADALRVLGEVTEGHRHPELREPRRVVREPPLQGLEVVGGRRGRVHRDRVGHVEQRRVEGLPVDLTQLSRQRGGTARAASLSGGDRVEGEHEHDDDDREEQVDDERARVAAQNVEHGGLPA